jgi:nicotinic acid phosphoribosyltransferase
LLADRVGLRPRTTEGHEWVMGFVAAFKSARREGFSGMAVAH